MPTGWFWPRVVQRLVWPDGLHGQLRYIGLISWALVQSLARCRGGLIATLANHFKKKFWHADVRTSREAAICVGVKGPVYE